MTLAEYLVRLSDPIVELLPTSACIQKERQFWSAIWTTPAGVWEIRLTAKPTQPDTIELTGPRLQLTIEDPDSADLPITILRTMNALPPAAPPSTSECQ